MKVVQLTQIGRPLEAREIPVPEPADYEVLVRVEAAGICHSDVHYRSGVSPVAQLPLIPGHEVSGMVERVGPRVLRRRVGDRVCLHYLLTCGETEIIGVSDHLLAEMPLLLAYARRGMLDLSPVVTRTIPLEAQAINAVMDDLEQFKGQVRTVIVPTTC